MLRKIEFENFMSLKSVSIELEPLTVFIGPNASGKSAIFKGLVTLGKLLNRNPLRGQREFSLEAGVNLDEMVWAGNSGLPMRFRVWFEDNTTNEPSYALELGKRAQGWSVIREKIGSEGDAIEINESQAFQHPTERLGDKSYKPPLQGTLRYMIDRFLADSVARPVIDPIQKLTERFGQAWRYRPSASDIASFVPHPTPAMRRVHVHENGWGVSFQLQDLQGRDRGVFERIEKAICQLFPHIRAIGFETDYQGVRLRFMTDRSQDPVPAPQESDGALLATFLYWRLYTAGPELKICLEEPENGLHPYLLGARFGLLKKFAYATEAPPVQILLATHSPYLLRVMHTHPMEFVKPLRLVEFSPAGGTSVRPLKLHEVAHLWEAFLTGAEPF